MIKAPRGPNGPRQTTGNAFMILGVMLLGAFGGFKLWTGHQSSAGLDAFEAARDAQMVATATPSPVDAQDELVPAALAAQFTNWGGTPDTSSWSPQRLAEYEAARAAADDAPQAVLAIDHLNIRVPVYNGADDLNLNRGVARIIGTGRIGEGGNLGIAGHRDGFFRPLKDIEIGDRFSLETFYGTEEYEVASIEIVEPTELRVLAPTDTPTVTLVTCYPFYHVGSAPQRFIVKAVPLSHQVTSQRRNT